MFEVIRVHRCLAIFGSTKGEHFLFFLLWLDPGNQKEKELYICLKTPIFLLLEMYISVWGNACIGTDFYMLKWLPLLSRMTGDGLDQGMEQYRKLCPIPQTSRKAYDCNGR